METLINFSDLAKLPESSAAFFMPLVVAVGIYWFYCFLASFLRGALLFTAKKSRTYFIADRSLNKWFFIVAATATSFSGWTFISHPGVIYQYGFSAAYISFYAITIPLAGVFFLKRQWMLGQRCGFVTPGEMFYAYFKSDLMRYLVLIVAILFSVFYIAVQLRATGHLFHILTDYKLSIDSGIILLSGILLIYVTLGGLRAVAYIDTMQAFLLAAGIIALGWLVLHYVGGDGLGNEIETLAGFQQYFHDQAKYFTVPSLGSSETKQAIVDNGGNYWSATLIFTFLFALMGIQSSPAFSMWAFATKDPNAFGYQQVWASSLGIGLIMIIFTALIGVGGHFLGLDYSLRELTSTIGENRNFLGPFIENKDLLGYSEIKKAEGLVPLLIRMTLDISPFLIGILALSALAAIQSTAASYMSTVGSMLSRDLLKNGWLSEEKTNDKTTLLWIVTTVIAIILCFVPISTLDFRSPFFLAISIGVVIAICRMNSISFGDIGQKIMAVVFSVIITFSAINIATVSEETLAFMGALAVAYGVQMMPALIAICWSSFFTKNGIQTGLIVGLIVVTLAELNHDVFFLAFGQWRWGLHSAFWGFMANLLVAWLISFLQSRSKFESIVGKDDDKAHREKFHRFLNDPFLQNVQTPLLQNVQTPRPNWTVIIVIVIGWAVLTIVPFTMDNPLFGLFGQSTDSKTWWFYIPLIGIKVPPIWAWQIICLLAGVVMMYWLAFVKRLSTFSKEDAGKKIQPLTSDISEHDDKYCEAIYPNSESGRT